MTIAKIKAMFVVGDQWEADNTYNPKACGLRTLAEKKTTQFVWKTPEINRCWMNFPRQQDIVEAADGLLTFKLWPDNPEKEGTLTLRKVLK